MEKAWSVVYANGAVLVEDKEKNVWWDDIDWKAVQQLNVMGVVIPPPFEAITYFREALATSGSSGAPVAIICSVKYKEVCLTLKFIKIME